MFNDLAKEPLRQIDSRPIDWLLFLIHVAPSAGQGLIIRNFIFMIDFEEILP
jgi:hypothetical protein